MKIANAIAFDKQIYYRLIALWILCEAVLGGLMHAVKIPLPAFLLAVVQLFVFAF